MNRVAAALKAAWARVRTEEPARLAEGVRLLLVALVGTGWVFRAAVKPLAKLDYWER